MFKLNCKELPSGEFVDDLEEFLKTSLSESIAVTRSGSTINIDGEITKRRIKFLARKFIGKVGLQEYARVIANGKESYDIIYRKFE
ncbi:MAG: 60S ribosomal protein L22 [Candidatus Hodarchaeota archaeon]